MKDLQVITRNHFQTKFRFKLGNTISEHAM